MRKTAGVMAAILMCAFAAGAAVDIAQGMGSGHVDTGSGQLLPGITPTVTVSVPKPLIRLVTVASGGVAPEVGELLDTVDHIQVKVYDRLEDGEGAQSAAAKFVASLQENAWHPMVEVAEGDEQVKVMLKTENDVISGMVALVTSGHELVFVNVSGNIDPEKTGLLISVIGDKYMKGTLLPPALMQQLPGPHRNHMQPHAAPAHDEVGEASEEAHTAAANAAW